MIKVIVAVVGGAVLGVVGARFVFVGSALSLIPWAIVGLGLGVWCVSVRESLKIGICYGFALAFAFMIAGYAGSASLFSRLVPFAILGLVGAACGLSLGIIGYVLRTRLLRIGKRPTT